MSGLKITVKVSLTPKEGVAHILSWSGFSNRASVSFFLTLLLPYAEQNRFFTKITWNSLFLMICETTFATKT